MAALLLSTVPTSSHAQVGVRTENAIWNFDDCPRLPYKNHTDSVAMHTSADSVAMLMAGRWELVEISNGWGTNSPPACATELVVNDRKQVKIYLDGVLSDDFTLIITRQWSMIQFRTMESDKPFFDMKFPLRSSKHGTRYQTGLIRVCEQKMIISDSMADGFAYAFRKIPAGQPTVR